MKEIFRQALPVLERLEDAGFEAYFVGGSVRDYLLNRPIDDVDIATSALPEEVKKIFPKTVDVGIEHGTVLVLHHGRSYEVTTFRTDGKYEDFRRPSEVTFIRSLYEDLKRRDFTMNAIAMTRDGKLIDPFGGTEDIRKKIIRTVGSPEARFHEDALRMMRAVRFISQLTFDLDGETARAIAKEKRLLDFIAVERKWAEMEKLLAGKNRRKALQTLIELGIHHHLPGLAGQERALREVAYLSAYPFLDVIDLWALIGLLTEKENVLAFLRQWKMSNEEIKRIVSAMEAARYREQTPWDPEAIYRFGKKACQHGEAIYQALHRKLDPEAREAIHQMYEKLPIKERSELAISGHDLMKWEGRQGGPWLKIALERVERAVIRGRVENEKERIRHWYFSEKEEKGGQ
jgi:Poly A polymerase head domain.